MKSFVSWLKFDLSLLMMIGPIANKSALIQVMAWHRTGDKPLSEPMMTQFTDAWMHQLASMG